MMVLIFQQMATKIGEENYVTKWEVRNKEKYQSGVGCVCARVGYKWL